MLPLDVASYQLPRLLIPGPCSPPLLYLRHLGGTFVSEKKQLMSKGFLSTAVASRKYSDDCMLVSFA